MAAKAGKWGQVEMCPLRQTRSVRRTYPNEEGVLPLLDVVQAPERLRPVMEQIFGYYVLCQDLEKCKDISERFGLYCITLGGDRISPDGIVSGGYDDPKRYTRISNSMKEQELLESIASIEKQMGELDARLEDQDGIVKEKHENLRGFQVKLEAVQAELQRVQLDHRRARSRLIELEKDTAFSKAQLQLEDKKIADTERLIKLASEAVDVDKLNKELEGVNHDIQVLKQEMDAEQKREDAARQRRVTLLASVDEKKNEIIDIDDKIELWTTESHKAEQLRVVVEKRQQEFDRIRHERNDATRELTKIQKELDDACEQKEVLVEEVHSLVAEQARKTALLDEKLASLSEQKAKLERATESAKQYPTYERTEMAKNVPIRTIRANLAQVRQRLSEFGKVNMEAETSYMELCTFITRTEEQLEEHRVCLAELDTLKEYLKARRKVVVDSYFHTFSEEFTRIFKKLGGAGTQGCLYKLDETPCEEGIEAAMTAGIRTAVDFGNGVRKNEQLSGGQKTIVALSQILALQHFESAPFFIFDEVDAALDIIYKSRLAELLRTGMRHKRQIILTSHAPEMLRAGHALFHVSTDRITKFALLRQLTLPEGEALMNQTKRETQSSTQPLVDKAIFFAPTPTQISVSPGLPLVASPLHQRFKSLEKPAQKRRASQ